MDIYNPKLDSGATVQQPSEKAEETKYSDRVQKPPEKKLSAEQSKLEKDTHHVIIHFGPTNTFHTLCHRPQKLKGLTLQLKKLGYVVDLVKEPWMNMCVLEMCGHEIFRANMNELGFNIPYETDITARRAVDAVLKATKKFTRSGTYFSILGEVDSLGDKATCSTKKVAQMLLDAKLKAARKSAAYYAAGASYIRL